MGKVIEVDIDYDVYEDVPLSERLKPYMSKEEITKRFKEGCPVHVLAELNGCWIEDIIKNLDGVTYKTKSQMQDERILSLYHEGYSDRKIAEIMKVCRRRVKGIRERHGFESNYNLRAKEKRESDLRASLGDD